MDKMCRFLKVHASYLAGRSKASSEYRAPYVLNSTANSYSIDIHVFYFRSIWRRAEDGTNDMAARASSFKTN